MIQKKKVLTVIMEVVIITMFGKIIIIIGGGSDISFTLEMFNYIINEGKINNQVNYHIYIIYCWSIR